MSSASGDSFQSDLIAAVPNLRAFGLSLCGTIDRADDLVQETLVKAWNARDSFTPGTNLKAWLFAILRNTYYSQFRKQRREVSDPDGEMAARLAVGAEQYGHMDMVDFRKALACLSDDQREALILVGAEGFSYEEVAEISGCAVCTVKSRVNRARNQLADLLGIARVDGGSALSRERRPQSKDDEHAGELEPAAQTGVLHSVR